MIYSAVKYRESLPDRRKKEHSKIKENGHSSPHCDMNQNMKTGQLSLSSIESSINDSHCDRPRAAVMATASIVKEVKSQKNPIEVFSRKSEYCISVNLNSVN